MRLAQRRMLRKSITLNLPTIQPIKTPNKIKCIISKEIRSECAAIPLIGRQFIERKRHYAVIFPPKVSLFYTKKGARGLNQTLLRSTDQSEELTRQHRALIY